MFQTPTPHDIVRTVTSDRLERSCGSELTCEEMRFVRLSPNPPGPWNSSGTRLAKPKGSWADRLDSSSRYPGTDEARASACSNNLGQTTRKRNAPNPPIISSVTI